MPAGYRAPSITSTPLPPIGAGAGAAGRQSSVNNRNETKTSTVHIDTGDIHVYTQADDARGVADAVVDQLHRQASIASWNPGLT